MASAKQIEFFRKLTEDRDFGSQDVAKIREQFAAQSDASASQWIDKAMTLPRKESGSLPTDTPPPFGN